MHKSLSQIQKQKFLDISGIEYDETQLSTCFSTPYPYNNREWSFSPWQFSFAFVSETACLFCELTHPMTNNRIFGWDSEGNELSIEEISKYFKPDS